MPKIISVINLKGGVGKTTLAVNLAALLAHGGARTLLIDLDSQSNASVAVMSPTQYEELDARGLTIASLFEDQLKGRWENPSFNVESSIRERVGGLNHLDLLPSSMSLIDLQDDLRSIRNPFCSPVDILGNAVSPILGRYEYVIVDCPPNLGVLTLNGFLMSHYYLIPTFTDFFAKYGIHMIQKRVNLLKKRRAGVPIELLGIVLSKVRETLRTYQQFAPAIRENLDYGDKVFQAMIHDRTIIGQATAISRPLISAVLPDREARDEAIRDFRAVKNEMLTRIHGNV